MVMFGGTANLKFPNAVRSGFGRVHAEEDVNLLSLITRFDPVCSLNPFVTQLPIPNTTPFFSLTTSAALL